MQTGIVKSFKFKNKKTTPSPESEEITKLKELFTKRLILNQLPLESQPLQSQPLQSQPLQSQPQRTQQSQVPVKKGCGCGR